MKKFFLSFFVLLLVFTNNAQIPDLNSISDEQKIAYLRSLSASDRALLLRELQNGTNSQAEPLQEVTVVRPLSSEGEFDSENELEDETEDETEDEVKESSYDKFRDICEENYKDELLKLEEDEEVEVVLPNKGQFIRNCLSQQKDSSLAEFLDLKPFGYDLFAGSPTTFAPATEIPVPQNYVLGPGDTLKIFTYGNESESRDYVVDRDGVININKIGPVVVAGMSFSEVKQAIDDRFSTQMIGVKTSVTLGELRSVRVFVLGEAKRSGSFTVSSLSTITNALFVSGGVKEIGSLRNIQLKRNGRTVSTLDLYDLLLKGNTSKDVRLQPGDVIFIPTVGDLVSIAGNVKRPAIYETKNEHDLKDFVDLAGGVLPSANLDDLKITRIDSNKTRKILSVDYSTKVGQQVKIKAGDIIEVSEVLAEIGNSVSLQGHVKRPGARAYFNGMKILDLIGNASSLKNKVDLEYALVRRLVPPANKVKVHSFNLRKALTEPGSIDNLSLKALDTVYIFELGGKREAIIEPLIEELEQQSGAGDLLKQVSVSGRIKVPGSYPLEKDMAVSDLIRAGGGLTDAAYGLEAEVTRDELDENSEVQVRRHIKVNLKALLAGDKNADVILRSRDRLYIKEVPNWSENSSVELLGEVQFPGVYSIKSGETLGQVLQRAGGLNKAAFPEGALFIRESLQEKEARYLASLADRLEKDIVLLSIEKDSAAVETGESLLQQLREAEAVGRLVIDLNSILANVGDELKDVFLQSGDKIFVPEKTQEVTVVGEVQFPTSHLYDGNSSREAYLAKSGGFTSKADEKRVYIVRANGSVVTSERTTWFAQRYYDGVQPGDTIVVPLDADRVRALTLWTSVTQILSQIGIFAASANAVGIL